MVSPISSLLSISISIRQIGNDRRIEIDIESKDEIGDTIYRTVILEIMGSKNTSKHWWFKWIIIFFSRNMHS
jgi:hypothetical protein